MSESRRLLVSAGPSREYFDDVRYLSNGSSGAMGIAVAEAALAAGWQVVLALGPTHLSVADSPGLELRPFVSARDLEAIACECWPSVHAFVATAAVCDYRPAQRIPGKRKKTPGDWQLSLERNPDVLAGRGVQKGGRCLVGFALEASLDQAEARRKLEQKNLDLVLLNCTANMGSAGGDFDWIERGGRVLEKRAVSKIQLAQDIVGFLGAQLR